MRLAITDPMREEATYLAYLQWLRRHAKAPDVTLLSSRKGNEAELASCDGLVLAGGGDVHPKFYPHDARIEPLVKDVNEERDRFEFSLIHEALRRRMPVLGICRGAQVFNVALGGTLIADIEDAGFASHRKGNVIERLHPVRVEPETAMLDILGTRTGDANTFHHQAVAVPGNGLKVSVWSHDGVVEGLEWRDRARKPFILMVQWHPERMRDPESPFSKNILERFMNECYVNTEAKSTTHNDPYLLTKDTL